MEKVRRLVMFSKLGYEYCRSILKAYIVKAVSKVGTKNGALVADPVTNLETFGGDARLTKEQIDEAEKCLVNVYHRVKIIRIES